MAKIIQFPPRRPSLADEVADLIVRWVAFDAKMTVAECEGLFTPETVTALEQELALLQADLERLLLVVNGRRIQ